MVEDDPGTRQALCELLDTTSGFFCAGAWGSVEAALTGLPDAGAQVLALDINLPGMQGTDGVKQLKAKLPGMEIVMLTVLEDADAIFDSICNGACGYMLKKTPPQRILEAFRDAVSGGSPMTPEVARRVVERFQKSTRTKAEATLTAREREVIALLAEGYSYAAIAGNLQITINTVRNRIRSVYEKLQVHSRSEAVSKAIRDRHI